MEKKSPWYQAIPLLAPLLGRLFREKTEEEQLLDMIDDYNNRLSRYESGKKRKILTPETHQRLVAPLLQRLLDLA